MEAPISCYREKGLNLVNFHGVVRPVSSLLRTPGRVERVIIIDYRRDKYNELDLSSSGKHNKTIFHLEVTACRDLAHAFTAPKGGFSPTMRRAKHRIQLPDPGHEGIFDCCIGGLNGLSNENKRLDGANFVICGPTRNYARLAAGPTKLRNNFRDRKRHVGSGDRRCQDKSGQCRDRPEPHRSEEHM